MAESRHVEIQRVHGRRLGRRAKDTARPVLKLGDYLTGTLPTYPASVDYFSHVPGWILGGNDRFGTCGPTSLSNYLLLVSTWLGNSPVTMTDEQIFTLYRASGNPDFDPLTGAGDNGVDMTVMLSAALKGGLGGYKPLAFAAVNGNDPQEVWAAGALFGGALWGCDLDVAQQQQTNRGLWDYTTGSRAWGGHAVLSAGRFTDKPGTVTDRTGLVTWAEVVDSTDLFITQQVPERYVVITDWHLGSKTFLQGVDLATLAADYTALTGRPFPAKPSPAPPLPPAPAPGPANADVTLWTQVGPWAAKRRIGANQKAANAINTWAKAKGFL